MYKIKYYGTSSPRPEVTLNSKCLPLDEVVTRLNKLEKLVNEAHDIMLHEIDNGRMPTMLIGQGVERFNVSN